MALPESSLSIVCSAIAQFVRNGVNAAANNIGVRIGAPADVPGNSEEHRLNLFFYRLEPGGFDSVSHPNDPWRLRLFCMISAFGIDDDGVPAGENDLRILGEVLRIFREAPVLEAVSVNGEQVVLQVVFSPATDEQINQIWSTQGDTTYRPSVIYEMALAVIVPSRSRLEPPLVGALGKEARGAFTGRYAAFSGTFSLPRVPFTLVNIENPQWNPALCWVYEGECAHTLAFDVEGSEFAAFTPRVWLAGDPGDEVQLMWEVWDRDGWREAGAPVSAFPFSTVIDPEKVPPAVPGTFPLEIALPVTIPHGQNAAQGLLYARRRLSLMEGGPVVTLRSNPLLISLYRIS